MSVKTTIEKTGEKIAETATKVGHRISEGAEKATDWAKEKLHKAGDRIDETSQKVKHSMKSGESCGTAKTVADIQPKQEVIASCGTRIGKVDHLDGANSIKLMKNDPDSGGQHHWIPTSWVAQVDDHVHLNVNSEDAKNRWKTDATSCGSCS